MNNENGHQQYFPSRLSFNQNIFWIASVALFYFVTARLSLSLVFQPEGIAAVWPLSGIFLSAILLTRRSVRPYLVAVLFVTDFIAEMLAGIPFLVSTIYALELSGDAVLSSWLLFRFVGEPITFRKVRDVFWFIVLAIIISNGLMSLVAAGASGLVPGTSFWNSWKWWAASTGVGNLLVTPFILSWASREKTGLGNWNPKKAFEIVVMFILLALVNFISFIYLSASDLFSLFLPYLTLPFLMWAALRFEVRGVTSALVIIAAISISFVATGRVAGFHESQLGAVIVLQFYLAIMAVPSLFLAAVVSDRKQTEKDLWESEEKFRTIFDRASDGILIADTMTKKFLQGNTVICSMLGYTKEEIETLTVYDIHPAKDIPHILDEFEKQAKGEIVLAENLPVLRKDRSVFYADIGSSFTTIGGIHCLVGTFHDITERKRSEENLKRNEALLSASQKIAHVGSWEMDLASKRLTWSDEVYRIFGLEPQEFEASYEDFIEFVHPEDRAAVDAAYTSSVREGRDSYEIEHRIVLRNTTEIRFVHEKCIHIRDATGCIVCSIGMVQDITQRKRAEEEKRNLEERLNRAEKMESLGILAGGVAHDLNNVLGVVVGYAEMLLMVTDKSNPVRSKLVNIMEAAQKAATIVGDLLTLARRGVSGRDVVNLNKIIADLQQSPEFEKLSSYNSAVKIKTELDPDLLNISASSIHLNKTLFNLMSNAYEAMRKGGCMTIKTSNRYLDKPIQGYDKIQEGDYVVLSVSDTGEGINAHDMKRIFEPFYTKKVMGRSGTGLGLAVVWGTVKDHSGYINVESEEGKGSAFTLYFPVTREELSAEQVAVSISEYVGKGESVLVVDDVKEQRNLAEEMLRKLNYSVTSVSSGEEALLYLKDHKVDLMILDMIMDPGMDGLDTYRQILEIHPKQKAIIVSGFSESDRVKAAQALGAGAYVRKPYISEKLGLAVRKELDRAT